MQQGDVQPEPAPAEPARGAWPRRLLAAEPLPPPDPRRLAPREIAGAIIGAEAGAGIGLLVLGSVPFAPLGAAALGAATGFGAMRIRHALVRRWLRHQLRAAR
jgi:hypothetical protein